MTCLKMGSLNSLHQSDLKRPEGLLEKCIMLKERIIQLARDGRIILDLDDLVGTNHTFAQLEHYLPS